MLQKGRAELCGPLTYDRLGEFNGSDARPVRLQSPARENVKTSFRSKLLFTRSRGPLIRPGQFAARDRAASGKVAFSARRTVETLVVPLMRQPQAALQ